MNCQKCKGKWLACICAVVWFLSGCYGSAPSEPTEAPDCASVQRHAVDLGCVTPAWQPVFEAHFVAQCEARPDSLDLECLANASDCETLDLCVTP